MQEGLPSPTPEELESVKRATKEADPTTFSHLPPPEGLVEDGKIDGRKNITATSEGERYIGIREDSLGAAQQAVARLLKGIINVSDIVGQKDPATDKTQFYSHEMPLERIAEVHTKSEVAADLLILEFVVGDSDHRMAVIDKPHNLVFEDGKAAYFDFEIQRLLVALKHYPFHLLNTRFNQITDRKTLEVVEAKSKMVIDRFSGEEGERMLTSIITASGELPSDLFYEKAVVPPEGEIRMLQDAILEKAERLHKAAEDRLLQIKD